jgi:hypothetical protein
MGWLEEYKQDIVARERNGYEYIRGALAPDRTAIIEELKEVFDMIAEGTSDSEDLQRAIDVYWRNVGPQEVEVAQEDAAIQRRLTGLYAYLEHATSDEWVEYARMIVNTRFLVLSELLPLFPARPPET